MWVTHCPLVFRASRLRTPSQFWPLLLSAIQRCSRSTLSSGSKFQYHALSLSSAQRTVLQVVLLLVFTSVPPRSACRRSPTSPSWPCLSCTCWLLFLVTSPFSVRRSLWIFVLWMTYLHHIEICQRQAFAPPLVGAVESELLHTYSRVDPLDVLILCVRLAVLVAVTLTVPVVLFPVRKNNNLSCLFFCFLFTPDVGKHTVLWEVLLQPSVLQAHLKLATWRALVSESHNLWCQREKQRSYSSETALCVSVLRLPEWNFSNRAFLFQKHVDSIETPLNFILSYCVGAIKDHTQQINKHILLLLSGLISREMSWFTFLQGKDEKTNRRLSIKWKVTLSLA